MEGGSSSTGQLSDLSQSQHWSRQSHPRRNTLGVAPPLSSTSNLIPIPLNSSGLDLLPVCLPQTQANFQQRLVDYNKLIDSGGPPRHPRNSSSSFATASTSNDQARRGSVNQEIISNSYSNTRGNGNKKSPKGNKGERSFMTIEPVANMADRKFDIQKQLPSRTVNQQNASTSAQQSNSVPSTPHQRARKYSLSSREPSPITGPNHSPRSAYSETAPSLPSLRPLPPPRTLQQCKYETAMQHTRRRIPYSIGIDKLESVADVKADLTNGENRRLADDMHQLYQSLLPTETGEKNRARFVHKLENMLNAEWPGHDIKVLLFGSSGNMLSTDDSDVDICITTPWKGLENVCKIADLLARNGLEKVVCVSTAKVPIVKAWDPELNIACDMNVNNTLALENTRMLRTYVGIDERVRPLAIIIKHWTKRRIVNDAAFGATLSSYTWICMVINFLQMRKPPILPALHRCLDMRLPSTDGHVTEFADDLDKLKGFGKNNKEDLAQLLFHFFRFYAHEMDYNKHVVSVRNGSLLSKVEKGWQYANNNMLCVEEPFSINRNLANTADDTSFRGLHIEIRRAFDFIAQADLESCCMQYEFPKEEERIYERPVVQSKPIISRTPSQSSNRPARGGFRATRGNRNGGSHRRVSAGAYDNPNYVQNCAPMPQFNPTAEWMSQQSDMLNTLKAQENTLRNVLLQSSQTYAQAQAHAQYQANRIESENPQDRHRGSSFDNPPLTAPIRPDAYFWPMVQPASVYPSHGLNGYPSSTLVGHTVTDMRQANHRTAITNAPGVVNVPGSAMRSHSQPPRPVQVPVSALQGIPVAAFGNHQVYYHSQNGIPISVLMQRPDQGYEHRQFAASSTSPPNNIFPKEYIGYIVHPPQGQQPPSYYASPQAQSQAPSRKESMVIPQIPPYSEAVQAPRRPSTDQFPHAMLDRRVRRGSRSPSPLDYSRDTISQNGVMPVPGAHLSLPMEFERHSILENDTGTNSDHTHGYTYPLSESSISEDFEKTDNLGRVSSNHHEIGVDMESKSMRADTSGRDVNVEPLQQTPPIPNSAGRTQAFRPETPQRHGLALANGEMAGITLKSAALEPAVDTLPALPVATRPSQNGLALKSHSNASHGGLAKNEVPHLSPVSELPSPSPSADQKLEFRYEQPKGLLISKDDRINSANGKPHVLGNGTVSIKGKGVVSSPVEQSRSSRDTVAIVAQRQSNPTRVTAVPKANGHKTVNSDSSVVQDEAWQQSKPKQKKKSIANGLKKGLSSATSVEKPFVRESDRKGG